MSVILYLVVPNVGRFEFGEFVEPTNVSDYSSQTVSYTFLMVPLKFNELYRGVGEQRAVLTFNSRSKKLKMSTKLYIL